jgi:hypothetical protein
MIAREPEVESQCRYAGIEFVVTVCVQQFSDEYVTPSFFRTI